MLETVLSFIQNIDVAQVVTIGTAVVAAASAIAPLTPTKVDDKFTEYLAKGINWLALNFHVKVKNVADDDTEANRSGA